MKSSKAGRRIASILATLTTVLLLSACGGSGSSSTGSSFTAGSASLSGNVSSGIAFKQSENEAQRLLAQLINLAIAQAHASGISGVTVELVQNGAVLGSQQTTASGDFIFNGLQPGNYTVRLSQGGQRVGVSPVIQLDANTRTRLDMNLDGKLMEVEIEAERGTIKGEVEEEHDNDHDYDEDHDEYRDDDHDDDYDDDDDDHDDDHDDDDDEDDDRDEDDDDCDDDDDDDDCEVKRS